MGKLEGKVAVITGGSSGIGLATAEQFVKEGAKVFITGRRQSELDLAVNKIGKDITGIQGDVSNIQDLENLYKILEKQVTQIDILVVNAGIGNWASLEDITEEHYYKIFDINVKGALFSVQKALPLFRLGGSIILIGSIMASKGTPALSVYSASKAALRSFARSWIHELNELNIRVNVLSPGATETPGFLSIGGIGNQEIAEQFKASVASSIPRGRVGDTREVANVAVFLASEDSSYINGSEILVDGGVLQI